MRALAGLSFCTACKIDKKTRRAQSGHCHRIKHVSLFFCSAYQLNELGDKKDLAVGVVSDSSESTLDVFAAASVALLSVFF